MGQYKYHKDLFDLTFEKKWGLEVHFLKRSILSGIFIYLDNFKKCSRATLRCLAGRMWPAGRTLPRPALEQCFSTDVPRHTRVPHTFLHGVPPKIFLPIFGEVLGGIFKMKVFLELLLNFV